MKCPYCHLDHDRVIDSRASDDGYSIRRRRECLGCRRRYTTSEQRVESHLRVIKRDGTRVPFSRQKLKQGMERACWKRPISDKQLESAIAEIEEVVHTSFDTEVESRRLGEIVLEQLRELDLVAFVRFASVYRKFDSLNDFVETLRPMIQEASE
jgi:transcriptional repressor NrdR